MITVAEGRAEGKLPVMVFVHGEDYGYGGGHPYDPTMLVSQGNIIVVTMNYRLGILGKYGKLEILWRRSFHLPL